MTSAGGRDEGEGSGQGEWVRSGLNTAAPQESRSRALLYGGVGAAGLAVAAVVLVSAGRDADPSVAAQPPPASSPSATSPMPGSGSSGADSAPPPSRPSSGPSWSITPDEVPIGQSWTFRGSGFRPGEIVELQAFGAVVGLDQADDLGDVRYRSVPVDADQCDGSPLVVDVVRSDPEADEGEVLGTATVRLCSP